MPWNVGTNLWEWSSLGVLWNAHGGAPIKELARKASLNDASGNSLVPPSETPWNGALQSTSICSQVKHQRALQSSMYYYFWIRYSAPWNFAIMRGTEQISVALFTVPPRVCFQSHAFTNFTHTWLVGMVVRHILTVHICSLMCTNLIDMTAQILAFFTKLGTTAIYVKCSIAGHNHISHT